MQPKGLGSEKVPPQISIPAEARQAFEAVAGPSTSALASAGLLPLMLNSLEILDQVPLLIEEVRCKIAKMFVRNNPNINFLF